MRDGLLGYVTGKPKTAFLTRKWSLSEGTRVFVYIALYLTLPWFMAWLKAEQRAPRLQRHLPENVYIRNSNAATCRRIHA